MKRIKIKKKKYTYTLDPKVVEEFKKQSYEQNKSASERINDFMIKELSK